MKKPTLYIALIRFERKQDKKRLERELDEAKNMDHDEFIE